MPDSQIIRSDDDLASASRQLCNLMSIDRDLTTDESNLLDSIATAIESYERANYPIDAPSDAAILAHLIEAKDTSATETAKATGLLTKEVRAILRGEESIDFSNGHRLAAFFHVDPTVFPSLDFAPSIKLEIVGSPTATAGVRLCGSFTVHSKSVAKGFSVVRKIASAVLKTSPHSFAVAVARPSESRLETACG